MMTSLPSCETSMVSSPMSGLPLAARLVRSSMPWATELRRMCSMGPAMRSSTLRSISACPPLISRVTRLSVSLPA